MSTYNSARRGTIRPARRAAYSGFPTAHRRSKRMSKHHEPPNNVTQLPLADLQDQQPLALDAAALENVRRQTGRDVPGPAETLWRKGLIKLLNDSLATELVCVLRYKRHHYTAHGLASPRIAEEFAVHAAEEMVHADRLARRIVQMGGQPDFMPDTLTQRSHAAYNEAPALKDMILSNLTAERVAIEGYSQLVRLVGDRDPTTRRLLEDILADEQKHADELQGWLAE
jgi:bacterioferritin